MKKALVVVVVCIAVAVAVSVRPTEEFQKYMDKFNKQYSATELPVRMAAYYHSVERIRKANHEARMKKSSAKFAVNEFSDLFPEEFDARYKGYQPSKKHVAVAPAAPIDESIQIPDSFDWRTKGAVTPVKNQGQCGSCWAFSATEGVESAWFLAKGQTLVLSPQEVVSCDTEDSGCNGGDLPTAFDWIKNNGMEPDSVYPYTSGESGDSGTCTYNQAQVVAQISGFQYATQNSNETAMQLAMIPNGPLSICVDAETWQDYSGGVLTNNCGNSLDHCVQAVGWGTSAGTPYWIVRNSWGTSWGINGYIWVERNSDLCGIADEATYVQI